MLSNTKDSEPQQTTLSTLKGNKGQYSLDSPPPAAHISFKPEMVGEQYGHVVIISPEKRWTKGWHKPYVLTKCVHCGSVQWIILENLTRGKSKGCQQCSQPRQIPLWLDRRLTAAKQRCENPKDRQFPLYGARGIKFLFPSVTAAGLWIIKHLGLPKRSLELDRIDNNGHYAPGNIRFVTRQANSGNRRITVLSEYDPQYWPYARSVVTRKLSAGESREQIIADARRAVYEKRKNWRRIAARLMSMTYEMPDSITVTPYRAN
jgi:hypothetical protein